MDFDRFIGGFSPHWNVCVYMSEVNLIEKFIDWGFNGERSIKSCSLSLQSLFLCENCNKNFHWIFFCLVYLRFPQPASSFRQKKRKKSWVAHFIIMKFIITPFCTIEYSLTKFPESPKSASFLSRIFTYYPYTRAHKHQLVGTSCVINLDSAQKECSRP